MPVAAFYATYRKMQKRKKRERRQSDGDIKYVWKFLHPLARIFYSTPKKKVLSGAQAAHPHMYGYEVI